MSRILKKTAAFVRWLAASEELPTFEKVGGRQDARSFARRLPRGDQAGVVQPVSTGRADPRGFWTWLISGETLPSLDPDQDRHEGFLRSVLSQEPCPQLGSPRAKRKPGFTRWVLSRDVCPEVQAEAPGRGHGFWGWLLTREEL